MTSYAGSICRLLWIAILISVLVILRVDSLSAQVPSPNPIPTTELHESKEEVVAFRTDRIRVAIESVLSNPAHEGQPPVPQGTRLLNLRVLDTGTVIETEIDLSKEILELGTGVELEDFLHNIATGVNNEIAGQRKETRYTFLIEGIPLSEYQIDEPVGADIKQDTSEEPSIFSPTTGPLSDKKIVISPGHGWVWGESCSCWRLQRGYHWGIVEDFVNAEITMLLYDLLVDAGADVLPSRNMDKNAGNGLTGYPKWEEGAKYHIQSLDTPSWVWDTGSTDENKDINSRPNYSNWVDADILISIHNNGGRGTGTETWYDSNNGYQLESQRLARVLQNSVVSSIRTEYDSSWGDRGLKSCDGCKGENRLASRAAAIIEIAFMDTQSPDNDALHDINFNQLVATAMYEGVLEYFGVESTPPIDIYLLVDLSSSFNDDLPVFKSQAPQIIASITESNPNTRFGLGKFEDYPISPFGDAGAGDKAYEQLVDLTFDTTLVLNTIDSLITRYGGDDPESQLTALFQSATGVGQDLSAIGFPAASIPPGQQANFRDGAAKLFLLWTDAPFHLPADEGSIPYPGPSFAETVDAILALDPPIVIGISSGGGGSDDLEAMAAATDAFAPAGGVDCDDNGTIDIAAGEPLVCGISSEGTGIGDAIIALVGAASNLPIADAGGPYTGTVGEPITFDGSGSRDPDGTVVLYEWDFESNGTFDYSSSDPVATHSFPVGFSGVVTLRITDDDANTTTDTASVSISGRISYLPVISFVQPTPSNFPPNPPTSPSPFDGAIDQPINIVLGWYGSDPDGDMITYNVYFEADDSTPDVLRCETTPTSLCNPGILNHYTRYYWQVVAKDEHGAARIGPIWDFTTGMIQSIGVTGVSIGGPTSGTTGYSYSFTSTIIPSDVTQPVLYTWVPTPDSGQGTPRAIYSWSSEGEKSVSITASNISGSATDSHSVTIDELNVAVADATIIGPTSGIVGESYSFDAVVVPYNATPPVTYAWSPMPVTGQGTDTAFYSWTGGGEKSISITISNASGSASDSHNISIGAPDVGVSGVTISGPASGSIGVSYSFNATVSPSDATQPVSYAWSPTPSSGQDTANATYSWSNDGPQNIRVTASNASGSASDSHTITIEEGNRWESVDPLNVAREYHTATVLDDGRVLVVGGRTSSLAVTGSVELFDPETNSWTDAAELNMPRWHHTATLLEDSRVLVAGGHDGDGPVGTSEVYNPSTDEWTQVVNMRVGRVMHTATRLLNGRVLAVGGGGTDVLFNSAEIYNPNTNSWTLTGSMQTTRTAHTETLLLANGLVVVIGGRSDSGLLSSVEIFNPNTGNWTVRNSMSTARALHTATKVPGGIIVVGGLGASETPQASVELFNPDDNTWTSLSSMSVDRQLHTTSFLQSGLLLSAGGYGADVTGSGALESAEFYNRGLDQWNTAPSLTSRRQSHTASVLQDGRVLVVGGRGGGLIPINSAEIFSE